LSSEPGYVALCGRIDPCLPASIKRLNITAKENGEIGGSSFLREPQNPGAEGVKS
jgi:hypothetical protein